MIFNYNGNMKLIHVFLVSTFDSILEVLAISALFLIPQKDEYYNKILEYFNYSDRTVFIVVTSLVHIILYFSSFLFFHLCDTYSLFEKYKIQKTPKRKPSKELVWNTLKDAIFGQLIIQPITLYIVYGFAIKYGLRMRTPIPGFFQSFVRFFISYHLLEIAFYFTHRALHHPFLYKRFHKQHHEYHEPISISAEHASFFESLISAQIPTLFILFSGCHFTHFIAFLFIRLLQTYEVHSGYAFPWSIGHRSEYHYFHHSVNIGNYSGAVFLDSLFGTNNAWIDYLQKKESSNVNLSVSKPSSDLPVSDSIVKPRSNLSSSLEKSTKNLANIL